MSGVFSLRTAGIDICHLIVFRAHNLAVVRKINNSAQKMTYCSFADFVQKNCK